jgi:uncharacterized protein (TIGR02246 family)
MDDETQVAAAVLQRLEDAWNAADGDAFGAPFTEDADFVDVRGAHHRTREAIARGHQHIFETIYRGSRVRYELAQARRLTDDVILAHSSGTLDAPAGPLAGTQHATTSLVLVRAGDGWRVAAWHNTFAQA